MEKKTYSVITGTGSYIPSRVVKNEDFENNVFYESNGTIIDKSGKVILLDFDKAIRFNASNIKNYVQLLLDRWDRAVVKRSLGQAVIDGFKEGVQGALS